MSVWWWQWQSMATALDNNEVATRRPGQGKYECNNQLMVDYVWGEIWLDNTTRGGCEWKETSGWQTTQSNLAASNMRQFGSGWHDSNWAVDDTTWGHQAMESQWQWERLRTKQGNRAKNDTKQGGGRMTQHGGQRHNKRRGLENARCNGLTPSMLD